MKSGNRDGYAPMDLHHGTTVTLVRYRLTRDGWKPETITGPYRGRDRNVWHVGDRDLPRDEWAVCTE